MRKNNFFLFSALLAAVSGFLYFTPVFAKTEPASPYSSYISFSSENLSQGDVLLIKIKKEAGLSWASARFLSKEILFFKSEAGDLIGFAGVNAQKKSGTYTFTIYFQNGSKYAKNIKVVKRDFPTTKLVVNKELKEKGYTVKSVLKENSDIAPIFLGAIGYYAPAAFFKKPFAYPLSKITDVGNYGNIRKDGKSSVQHLGVDLEAEENTPVFAANDGIVCFVGELKNYGKTVAINHGLGIVSLYLHLNEFKVSPAQIVKRNDIIGLSGNTGYSLAPHLHFSLHIKGDSIDPLLFVETSIAGITQARD